MRTHTSPVPASRRQGLSALEVTIAIAGVLLLFVLITGRISSTARPEARIYQCRQNLRQLSIACYGFAYGQNDRLPYLENGSDYGSWARQLLIYLDNTALDKAIRDGADPSEQYLRVFACPDDTTAFGKPGGLSYAINTGFISDQLWNKPGDLDHRPGYTDYHYGDPNSKPGSLPSQRIFLSTGVAHRPSSPPALRTTFDKIVQGDGQAYTLLFAENVDAQQWTSRYTGDIAFGLEVDIDAFSQAPNDTYATAFGPANYSAITKRSLINSRAPTTSEGRFPRPNSNHHESVVVSFCDGRVRELNETIDFTVYISLITSDGGQHGEAVLDDDSFGF